MRRPRHLVGSAWYHVTGRVDRREMLLDRGKGRDLFLVFLARAKKRYRFHVANFRVMGNHIHLQNMPARGQMSSPMIRCRKTSAPLNRKNHIVVDRRRRVPCFAHRAPRAVSPPPPLLQPSPARMARPSMALSATASRPKASKRAQPSSVAMARAASASRCRGEGFWIDWASHSRMVFPIAAA